MSKPNRRKVITPDGRIIETDFDVKWAAIDKDGYYYLYEKKPKRLFDFWSIHAGSKLRFVCSIVVMVYSGLLLWETYRWYLNDKGKWVRK